MNNIAQRLLALANQLPAVERAPVPSFGAAEGMQYLGFGMAEAAGRPGATAASALGTGGRQSLEASERYTDQAQRGTAQNNAAAMEQARLMAALTGQAGGLDLQQQQLDQQGKQFDAKMAQDGSQFDRSLSQRDREIEARRAEAAAARQLEALALGERSKQAGLDRTQRDELTRLELTSREREGKLNRDQAERLAKLREGMTEAEKLKVAAEAADLNASSYAGTDPMTGKPIVDPAARERNARAYLDRLSRGEGLSAPLQAHEELGYSAADIEATMKKHGMSYDQVIQLLKARGQQ